MKGWEVASASQGPGREQDKISFLHLMFLGLALAQRTTKHRKLGGGKGGVDHDPGPARPYQERPAIIVDEVNGDLEVYKLG